MYHPSSFEELVYVTSHELILISGLIALVSGMPTALFGKHSNAGQRLATWVLIAGNSVGGYAIYRWWIDGPDRSAPPALADRKHVRQHRHRRHLGVFLFPSYW